MLLACNILYALVGKWICISSDNNDMAAALRAAGGYVWLGI